MQSISRKKNCAPRIHRNAFPIGYVVAEYLLQRMLERAQFSNEHDMEIFVFNVNTGGIEKLLWMNSLAASNHAQGRWGR